MKAFCKEFCPVHLRFDKFFKIQDMNYNGTSGMNTLYFGYTGTSGIRS